MRDFLPGEDAGDGADDQDEDGRQAAVDHVVVGNQASVRAVLGLKHEGQGQGRQGNAGQPGQRGFIAHDD